MSSINIQYINCRLNLNREVLVLLSNDLKSHIVGSEFSSNDLIIKS